jgi:hypothetical protein
VGQTPLGQNIFSNGLTFFLDTISLFGLRKNPGRQNENAWQPFSILTLNTNERPINAKSGSFFIGNYNYDGSLLFIESRTRKVYRCSSDDATPLNEWQSFNEMLNLEATRITKLFDVHGNELNPEMPTVPE